MVANQTECARLEQRSVIKFLKTGKCKTCENYKRMYDVYGKACFSQKECLEIVSIWVCLNEPKTH